MSRYNNSILLLFLIVKMNEQLPITKEETVYYYTKFHLFDCYESQLLSNYKFFIESMIMKLGEDWRIQSNLLSQEIIGLRSVENSEKDYLNFNIFNEFLSAYLRQKIGKEKEYASYSESQIQKKFMETVNILFSQEKIHGGLTFKTLSLGYCITATEVWNKTFRNIQERKGKAAFDIKPFAKFVKKVEIEQKKDILQGSSVRRKFQNIDIMSANPSMSSVDAEGKGEKGSIRWQPIEGEMPDQHEMKQIKHTLMKIPHTLKKAQVLSYFVSYVDQLHLKSGKMVRIFSISNEFYLNAFVIWLIFNIKMFFSLNFQDYLRYFKELGSEYWKDEFERPLKKFQLIVEGEWNKVLKDLTVALHDDQEVLNILVERVKKCIQIEWQSKITSLKDSFSKQ